MKKNDRIAAFVESLTAAGTEETSGIAGHPCYTGFFECFNRRDYFEAHDVLEQLWLKRKAKSGGADPCCSFFKGLIQVAGAMVHLQKQHARPEHPKDGRRLHPANRLYRRAMENLGPYRPEYLALNVDALYAFCEEQAEKIAASEYAQNPWKPEKAPTLALNHPTG